MTVKELFPSVLHFILNTHYCYFIFFNFWFGFWIPFLKCLHLKNVKGRTLHSSFLPFDCLLGVQLPKCNHVTLPSSMLSSSVFFCELPVCLSPQSFLMMLILISSFIRVYWYSQITSNPSQSTFLSFPTHHWPGEFFLELCHYLKRKRLWETEMVHNWL